MRYTKWLVYSTVITIISAIVLTQLPLHSGTSKNKDTIEVFEQLPFHKLSNHNIVDVMISSHLSTKLGKVEWNNATLTVELSVDPNGGRPEVWFSDLNKLIELSFVQLTNVNRMLVRIVESQQEGGRLMAAVDVRKNDEWLEDHLIYLRYSDPIHEELWRQRLRVSFTSVWEEHLGPVSGYTSTPAKWQ